MDKKIIDKVKRYAKLVKEITDVKLVVLYGSFAKGEENENSDIDVAIITDSLKEDFIELSAKLVDLVYKVDVRIEPTLLIRQHNKSGFIDSVIKTGKIIYSA